MSAGIGLGRDRRANNADRRGKGVAIAVRSRREAPECGGGPMSAGIGLRRRRREYTRNRPERGRGSRYSRPYSGRANGKGHGARRTGGSGAVNAFARLGFVARGIAYIVVGVIAIMVALGIAKHSPDRAGAIEAIATKPFGYLLLWVLVIGFLGLAVWRFVQAAVMRLNLTEGHRVRAFIYGVGYAILFVSTLMFVVHGRAPAGSDAAARDYTRSEERRVGEECR